MLRIVALMIILMSGNAASLPGIRLGAPVPLNAEESEESIMVSPAQIQKKWLWKFDGELYSLGIDKNKRVQYLATSSKNVITPEGVCVGQSFSEVQKVKGIEIAKWPGWGYVAELPSGWKAAFFIGRTMTERYPKSDDKVQLLFRGSAAGYGATLSSDK
jgi:hypothetical protein